MQPVKFETLITPPWPADQAEFSYYTPPHQQRPQAELANFERNNQGEDSLDHIAVLGYDWGRTPFLSDITSQAAHPL